MLLQIALDKPEHLALLPRIRHIADIVEIGTPLLKRFGIGAIATARELCPDTPVLADSKTVDGGQLEAEMVFGAGAAFMTVLSSATSATHEAVGRVAAKFGAHVVVDTITEAGKKELLPARVAFPDSFAYVGVHRPSDAHAAGDSSTAHIEAVAEMHRRGFRVALAGGLGPDSIELCACVRAGDCHRRQRDYRVRKSPRGGDVDTEQTGQSRPWLAVGQEIAALLDRIDAKTFFRIVQAFDDETRRWFFSGQGRSGLAAQMAAMRLMHVGRNVHFVGEVTAPSIRKGDGLVVISGSGETPVSVNFARIAKAEGAEVIVFTRAAKSTLAALADAVLLVPVEKTQQFGGSLFEQSSLILFDAMILEMAQRIPDAHQRMLRRHTNLQ